MHFHILLSLTLALSLLGSSQLDAESPLISNKEISESSGLACSTVNPNCFFTHNDSGDKPRLFVLDRQGKTLREISVPEANAKDWEDICTFDFNGKHWIAIGDIGDNQRQRDSVWVYIIEEPNESGGKSIRVSLTVAIEVMYPNGAVDAEGLAFDPQSSSLVIATKEALECSLLSFSVKEILTTPKIPPQLKLQVTPALWMKLSVPLATAADISRDGSRLAVATYGPLFIFDRQSHDQDARWNREGVQVQSVPRLRQGESVCFDESGKYLWLTSEHVPSPLIKHSIFSANP